MKPTIAILGSAVADIILEVPGLPGRQEDINILSQHMSLGGCAYNVSHMLQLYQVPYHLGTPIGSGIYGDFVRQRFAEEGVTSIFPAAKAPNGCCYCFVEPDGERTFLSYHGAEYQIHPEWLAELDHEPIDTLYLCGLELEEDTGIHLLNYVQRHPALTLYFAPGPRFSYIAPEMLAVLFQHHCILHLNDTEALAFTHAASIEAAAKQLYQLTDNTVIITLGEKGSYLLDQGEGSLIPSTIVNPVDTIGAGDAHIGTIIALRALHHTWFHAIQQANLISAKVVSVKGATLTYHQFHEAIS